MTLAIGGPLLAAVKTENIRNRNGMLEWVAPASLRRKNVQL